MFKENLEALIATFQTESTIQATEYDGQIDGGLRGALDAYIQRLANLDV